MRRVLLYRGRMPVCRLRVYPTLPPEVLARANERAEELGGSLSTLLEAFVMADKAHPIPGLAARVAEAEQALHSGRACRGRGTIDAAREARWKPPSER